jgi:hypothetical protein
MPPAGRAIVLVAVVAFSMTGYSSRFVAQPRSKERNVAKKNTNGRKSSGAAGIAIIEDPEELNQAPEAYDRATHEAETSPSKPKRKAKDEQQSHGSFGVGEIRKAAAFANSMGGLDKAITLLQILKVAKEVQ